MKEKDFTPTGLRQEGTYENDRNNDSRQLFTDIIREVYGVRDVIIGHHLVYQVEDKRPDGFTYQIVQEIPSADALIFDHDVAKYLWGDQAMDILAFLAKTPCADRDVALSKFYYERKNCPFTKVA